MRKIVLLMIAGAGIAGCAAPPKMIWLRTDGRYVDTSPGLQTQFTIDQTTCDGEAQKANLSAGTNYYGGIVTRAIEEGRRGQAAQKVLEGCMASKGYMHVDQAQAPGVAENLSATKQERDVIGSKLPPAR